MFSKTLYFCVFHLMYFLKSSINQNSEFTIFGHSSYKFIILMKNKRDCLLFSKHIFNLCEANFL